MMRLNLKYIAIVCFLFQSCDLMENDQGTGTIRVMINGISNDATDVHASEYFGFSCGGDILGKRLVICLGSTPKNGDTLTFLNKQQSMSSDICVFYGNDYALKESGKIIITKKSGSHIKGVFYCKIVVGNDTLNLSNGSFDGDFLAID